MCYIVPMPHLINPAGRIVCEDNLDRYHVYIEQGWKKPTKTQVQKHIQERYNLKEKMTQEGTLEELGKKAVYFSTVAQGGKDGYGIASGFLINGLREKGLDIQTYYNNQKLGILFHNPYGISKMETPFKFVYTMFESDKIPDEWIDYLYEADLVIVPSEWCKAVFAKAGISTRVVPLGYDDNVFKLIKRKPKHKSKEPFVFLHYNAFNVRKGFLELWKAFTEEFDPSEPVKLVLKTTLKHVPAGFPINPSSYPNIEVITEQYTDTQLNGLLEKSDCFVFPSRGEGFGMTPIEAMATGLPTIVPNAHGIGHYFDKRYMYEVNVEGECPALYSRYKGIDVGKMVKCDVKHLKSQMRYIYTHQEDAIKKGKLASNYVKKYNWGKTTTKLKRIIDEYYIKPIKEKKLKNILILEEVR
jgi:glycosyltransferase involved in cell wall biosynthesis